MTKEGTENFEDCLQIGTNQFKPVLLINYDKDWFNSDKKVISFCQFSKKSKISLVPTVRGQKPGSKEV